MVAGFVCGPSAKRDNEVHDREYKIWLLGELERWLRSLPSRSG
jgi:hypothetical protein